MKIRIIAVSKNKFAYIDDAQSDYLKRLKQYADVDLVVIKEEPIASQTTEVILKKEGERILAKLSTDYQTILLDIVGKEMSSEKFAEMVAKNRDHQGGRLQFIIGGPLGVSGAVKAAAALRLSISPMTFTHQLVRILLLEQIYRAFEILKGTGYHK